MNYRELYETGKERLEKAGIQEAALDARLLLEEVCRTDRNTLLVHGDRPVTEAEEKQFLAFTERRSTHEPLQQITGWQEFMGLRFSVTEDVLVPRQDTETLVEEVMRYLRDGMAILDVCTGSGCILLSLLRYSNGCRGVGCDISEKALAVARENAEELGLSAEFIQSDLFENIEGKFEYIVSNPPYIRKDVLPTLMEEVRDHEPVIALDGGVDGLDFYRRIIRKAPDHLCPGGMLFFEIGYDQGEAVKLAGLDRVVYGTFNGRK